VVNPQRLPPNTWNFDVLSTTFGKLSAGFVRRSSRPLPENQQLAAPNEVERSQEPPWNPAQLSDFSISRDVKRFAIVQRGSLDVALQSK
jgi:hypothetical protein